METPKKSETLSKFSAIKDRLDAQMAKAESAIKEVQALGVELKQFESQS